MRGKGFNYRGFTLVELLVTISILAILMTIALISYGNVQRNARDGKRKSDISTIQSALEQYHADQGYYPYDNTTTYNNAGLGELLGYTPPEAFTNLIGNPCGAVSGVTCPSTKTYQTKTPIPPSGSYTYTAIPNSPACNNLTTATRCTSYCLSATLENDSNSVNVTACGTGTRTKVYEVTAP